MMAIRVGFLLARLLLVMLLPSTMTAFVVPRAAMSLSIQSHHFSLPLDSTWIAAAAAGTASMPPGVTTDGADSSTAALQTFFWETVISAGVPTLFSLLVVGFTAFLFRRGRDETKQLQESLFGTQNQVALLYNDIYADQEGGLSRPPRNLFERFFSGSSNKKDQSLLPLNLGIPTLQYIRLTHVNAKYESFQYSVTAGTVSKAAAAAQYRQSAFRRAWQRSTTTNGINTNNNTNTNPLPLRELQLLERDFLQRGAVLTAELQARQTDLTAATVNQAMLRKQQQRQQPKQQPTMGTTNSDINKPLVADAAVWTQIQRLQRQLQELELSFVAQVVTLLDPEPAAAVRTALLGDMAVRGSGSLLRDLVDRPLNVLLMSANGTAVGLATMEDAIHEDNSTTATESASPHERKNVFVTRFPGDATASQVAALREQVTAISGSAVPGVDEVVCVLQTGGGTVTGYGLAAGQLLRLKTRGLKLTVAVEQVAASGGYMMCCVADRIVASPFAVLGSIGVISDIPNVYERLQREGIEFQTVTAGKFKRTLTPTKKVTREDFEKSRQDVQEIFVLFRDFVAQNRPQLDIEAVATGETWFGKAALERKLCDEIKTVDDLLTDFVKSGHEVYEVEYKPPMETPFGRIVPANIEGERSSSSDLFGQGVRWLVKTVAAELQAEFGSELNNVINKPIQERYMIMDNTSDRMKSQE
jgi:serine protease SohB